MKLLTKLTLFITGSKLLIVGLFIFLLPLVVSKVSFEYSNYSLTRQKEKVLDVIQKNGIDYYLQGDSAFGSYTLLKEEYISILPAGIPPAKDSIVTAERIIDNDTLNYRVLTHHVQIDNNYYLLEIGKTTSVIGQYNSLLQRFALYVLVILIFLSITIDLLYTNFLLRPLMKIIQSKLVNRKFPFKEKLAPVKTSTTDFKYLDASLISLMESIHDAFQKEREFTSNASHELLTPISILQNNIENFMIAENVTQSQQESLYGMMKTLARLKKIVHSLLYISRIENEQFLKTDAIYVGDIIHAIEEELQQKIELQQLSFINKVDSKLLLKDVNKDLLFQLFYNLVNNAIRYNVKGGSIEVFNRYDADLHQQVVYIKDSGIGIEAQHIATIFDRFTKSSHTNGEGFGLGLSIVKTIAAYHNFSLNVQSAPGGGAEFSVVLMGYELSKD